MRQHQIAFCDNALVPFFQVLYAVARLGLIVRRRHDVAHLVIASNSVTRIAWGKMDHLADGKLVRQICLLQLGFKTLRDRSSNGAEASTYVRTGSKNQRCRGY